MSMQSKTGSDVTVTLERLLYPINSIEFKNKYWEKRPLLIKRENPNHYDGLLSLADVDLILSNSSLRSSEVRVVRSGRAQNAEQLIERGELFGHTRLLQLVYEQYGKGATLVLQFLHERWKPLKRLCQTLSYELSAYFQANAYLTPAKFQGFDTHYDTHDVFIIQTEGSKRWRIYESPVELPLADQTYDSSSMQPGKVLLDVDLAKGDFLYIPRGYMHDARAVDETSLHLTVGIVPITWATMILKGVEMAVRSDRRLRESLPPGFATDHKLQKEAVTYLSDLFGNIGQTIDAAALISNAVSASQLSRQPSLEHHLIALEATQQITIDSQVYRRQDVPFRLGANENDLCLSFAGKVVSFPCHIETELRFVLDSEHFTIAALPGKLDDESKVTLIKRLVREGLLTTA